MKLTILIQDKQWKGDEIEAYGEPCGAWAEGGVQPTFQ